MLVPRWGAVTIASITAVLGFGLGMAFEQEYLECSFLKDPCGFAHQTINNHADLFLRLLHNPDYVKRLGEKEAEWKDGRN